MSQSSLRAPGSLGPLAVTSGRRTTALFTRAAGPTTAGPLARSATRRSTLAAGATAHPHLLKRLREFRQLSPIEFAVTVGVVLEGMLDEPLG